MPGAARRFEPYALFNALDPFLSDDPGIFEHCADRLCCGRPAGKKRLFASRARSQGQESENSKGLQSTHDQQIPHISLKA